MTAAVLACVRLAESLFVAALLVAGGCATEGDTMEPAQPGAARQEPRGAAVERSGVQRGLATYYADSLAGHKTASGERYDPAELTAAHRTLPFGTVVEVRRKDGRSVRVRINDRGPFAGRSRIIDLSRRAAEAIGLTRDGVATVTVSVVSLGPN